MKKRSIRKTELSASWAKRVYFLSNISNPTKADRQDLYKLWVEGYSNKDAAEILRAR